jgi:DNA-binding response OmpR family regulator
VLRLTGNGDRDDVRRATTLRADACIVKPFQAAKLIERLKTLLDLSE